METPFLLAILTLKYWFIYTKKTAGPQMSEPAVCLWQMSH
jgi:hypothetical protein